MTLTTIFLILALTWSEHKLEIENLDELYKDIRNSYERAQKIEKYQIKRYKDFVKRKKNKLFLKLDNGKQVILKDFDEGITDDTNIASGVWYSFRELLKDLNVYMIHVQPYEGEGYMLINKTNGKRIGIVGKVKVSPDKQRLVSYNVDLEAEYTPNGFQIIRILKDRFIEEYELFPDEWGPSNVKWINANEIEVEKTAWQGESLKVIGKVTYIYKNNKWLEKSEANYK